MNFTRNLLGVNEFLLIKLFCKNKSPSFFKKHGLLTCTNQLQQVATTINLKGKSEISSKVIYNSELNKLSFVQLKRLEKRELKRRRDAPKDEDSIPISLKYVANHTYNTVEEKNSLESDSVGKVSLPFRIKLTKPNFHVQEDIKNNLVIGEVNDSEKEWSVNDTTNTSLGDPSYIEILQNGQWMNDYEKYTNIDDNGINSEEWKLAYGTSDPSVPVSNVFCGGCGAYLHCKDPSIPGYLPCEIFKACDDKALRALTCQRCHFLQNYNTALSVVVDPKDYPTLISKIKDRNALIILLVDLTDFPCSIWPGVMDILGKNRPLFVVGNKVDLLWGDCKGWLDNVKNVLKASLSSVANIKHISLISAKTGFGLEELINKLHHFWQYKGDVYLVGCTNVGKSTLFNALLQSDYCKVKAVDLVQRATVAPWPGTTLNLLKFPILRPEGWRLYLRTQRLIAERKKKIAEEKLMKEQLRNTKGKLKTPPQLSGHLGLTFKAKPSPEALDTADSFSTPSRKEIRTHQPLGSGLDPNDPELAKSRWFYDTPGVLHENQILDLLTTEEITLVLPRKVIEPRTFLFRPNWSIFIAGLARLDYVKGQKPIRITVFSSTSLPITICETINAETVYQDLKGSKYMVIPSGGNDRLKSWPDLTSGLEVTLCGVSEEKSCADIIMSSAGWISITPDCHQVVKLLPWTPFSRGIFVRHPSLLPFAVSLRGKKLTKYPVYSRTKILR